MRRTLLIGAIIPFFLTASAHSKDWEWVSGGNFNSMTVQNGGTADPTDDVVWLCGNLLVKGVRHNGVWTWTQVAPDFTEDTWVSGLVFDDGGSAAMVLTATGVAHSSDGAESWTVHALPAWIQYLTSLQMTGPTQAYAVGRNTDDQAILVSTVDGGASWELVYDSGEWPGVFQDLKVYDDGRATLVGNYFSGWMGWLGVIVETDDDFETVSRVDYDDQSLWALEAPTPEDHYALGGPDLPGSKRPIFVSRHGEGGSWVKSTLPDDIFQIADMTFDSALHGWVVGHFDDPEVGSGGVLLETDDGGEEWTRTDFCHNCVSELPMVEEPLPLPNSVARAGGELFVGQSAGGWPCSTGMCTGRVVHSSDGQQWDRVKKLTGFRYVDFDLASGALQGIAVGYDGHKWRGFTQSLEGGSWQDPTFPVVDCSFFGTCPPFWSEVHIIGDSEVWASAGIDTDPSQLMTSSDQGATWDFVDTGETISRAAPILSVLSPSSIWAAIATATNDKKIIATSNHGASWTTVLEGSLYSYTMVAHVSEMQYCYVVNSMACTKNGGVTWSYPSGPSPYTGLQLLDAEYGWSVGVSQQGGLDIYRTIDGGSNWTKLTHLDYRAIDYPSQMQFVSRSEGWLAVAVGPSGSSASLLKTVDGGETWTEVTDGVFLDDDLEGLVYEVAADGTGWLASRYSGMVLKTTPPATIFIDGFETGDTSKWSQ